MSKLRLLIVHKDHPLSVRGINSGAEMATISLARALAAAGHDVTVAAQLKDTVPGVFDGVSYEDLGPTYATREVLQRFGGGRPFIVISAGRIQPLIQSRDIETCYGRYLISHDRSAGDMGLSPKVAHQLVDKIIAVSHAQRDVLVRDGIPAEKVVVIHNGVDATIFRPGVPAARDWQRLVFSGALVQDKGPHLLIEAFIALKSEFPNLSLDVFGDADLWGRQQFFDQHAVQLPGLTFHGKQPQHVIADAFSRSGIGVIPSIWFDPFPLTALEAQVTGLPVVAFDVGGLREGLRDGETGVLVRDISVAALTESLRTLLRDPSKLAAMSARALAVAPQYFSWTRVANEIVALISQPETGLTSTQIGLVSTWNQACGLATYARYLFQQFSAGCIHVLAEESAERTQIDEPWVTRCWHRERGSYDELVATVRREGIKLLHINCHARFFKAESFVPVLALLRSEGVRVVLHLHNVFTFDGNLGAIARTVDRVVVHTPENRLEVMAHGVEPDRIIVLTHGVAVQAQPTSEQREKVRARLGWGAHERVVATFGFVQPHKGIDGCIEAVAALIKAGAPVRLAILGAPHPSDPQGRSYLTKLQAFAHELGVTQQVQFVDRYLDDGEIQESLAAADVVVMNYRSQHYEASGACALAVGAGAVVATSIAPPFQGFGDAVWHITSGFPLAHSLELLLSHEPLRNELRLRAQAYGKRFSWQRTAATVEGLYRSLGCRIDARESTTLPNKVSAPTKRLLVQNRGNTFSQRGGDTVVLERTVAAAKAAGWEVTVDLEGKVSPRGYSLVHLFNFALPEMVKTLAERCVAEGVPYVVTTLCEDVEQFHVRSRIAAELLQQYVASGQPEDALDKALAAVTPPAIKPFDNTYTAKHAAALICNGAGEAAVVKRLYGPSAPTRVVPVGFEVGATARAEQFRQAFGVEEFVLCVGRIESRKNQLMLLKALEHEPITVVLAGGGFTYQPEYLAAVRSFKRKGKTIITDALSPELLASAYAACRVHALPSWYELPGLVSLEAAAHGKPVVVSDTGTTRDYLGSAAYYCDPNDWRSIRSAVLSAWERGDSRGSKDQVRAWTWQRAGAETIAVYEEALGEKPTVRSKGMETTMAVPSSTVSEEALNRAEDAAGRKEYELAERLFAELEAIDPRHPRVLRGRGAVAFAAGEPERAKRFFGRAIAVNPADARAQTGFGMCQIAAGDSEGAMISFVTALHHDPEQVIALTKLVECSYRLERFGDLEVALERYLAKNPAAADFRFCLAGARFKSNKLREARREIEHVLRDKPDHPGAKALLDKLDGATAATVNASPASVVPSPTTSPSPSSVQRDDTSGAGWQNVAAKILGRPITPPSQPPPALVVERESTGSTQVVEPFSATDEKLVGLDDLKRSRRYDEVRSGITEILSQGTLSPRHRAHALCLRGELEAIERNLDAARATFEEVLSSQPHHARARCGRGALIAASGRWEEAKAEFEKALQSDPRSDVALAGLGMCASVRGQNEEAWKLYHQSLDIDPENSRSLLGLIELAYQNGRTHELMTRLQAYLELHPADTEFLYAHAGAAYACGKLDEARESLARIFIFDPQHRHARELEARM